MTAKIKSKLKSGTADFNRTTEDVIRDKGDMIMQAARVLIGIVRTSEIMERARSQKADLTIEVELTGGGVEIWVITIERTASSH